MSLWRRRPAPAGRYGGAAGTSGGRALLQPALGRAGGGGGGGRAQGGEARPRVAAARGEGRAPPEASRRELVGSVCVKACLAVRAESCNGNTGGAGLPATLPAHGYLGGFMARYTDDYNICTQD